MYGQGVGWLNLLGSTAGNALAILLGKYRKVLDPFLYIVLRAIGIDSTQYINKYECRSLAITALLK